MTRALVVGPRDQMEDAIESLYRLSLLHLVDHKEGHDDLGIGQPLIQATDASEVLVKLRSIASVLQIDEKAEAAGEAIGGDLRAKILSLELNISEEDAAKKKTQALLTEFGGKIDEMTPFAHLPLRLEDYRGYESLEVLAGKVVREISGLETVTSELERFEAPGILVVFVRKEDAQAMREYLGGRGFSSLSIPEGDGDPKARLAELTAEKARWQARLAEIEERLGRLRERYAGFLVSAKVHLEIQVEKAEAPLRFAVTDHSFVIEGWVPRETFARLKDALAKIPGIYVDELETDEHGTDPPILLRNAKPFRPFEMLVKLYSIPNYYEIDPTFTVALVFPIFFGLMIGDAGYGLSWFLFGLFLLRRTKQPGGFRDLVITVTWGGFFAFLFGMFVFADAFGIPFHEPHLEQAVRDAAAAGDLNARAELYNWSAILGFTIPLEAHLEKLYQVPDFIVLSILAAFLHLGIGYAIGVVNEARHSVKHALGKFSWLLILTGLFSLILVRTARWPGMGQTLWNGVFGWFPRGDPLGLLSEGILVQTSVGFTASNPIPAVGIYLLAAGAVILVGTEGGLSVMEIFGLIANLVSYARLAAVGVAKAAMALAFNIIVLTTFIFPGLDTGNYLLVIVGLVFGFLFHLIVFLLGAVSAFIQSIRLNYVEYFLKFFKGAGTEFRPFGMRTKPEV